MRAATPSVGTPKPSKNDAGEDDEPPLNEDDDDELDDLDQEEEETNTQHLVLALFDKVIAVNGTLSRKSEKELKIFLFHLMSV